MDKEHPKPSNERTILQWYLQKNRIYQILKEEFQKARHPIFVVLKELRIPR
jgi:hypothetical protein